LFVDDGADDFLDDGRDPFPASGRAAHDAARFGVRAEVSSMVVDRRPPSRTWYARKRVLMPVIVLVAIVSFAAGQGTSRPGNDDVRLADAPAAAPTPPGSGSSGKSPSETSSAPTRRPRETTPPRATPVHRPTTTKPRRTTRAPVPEPTRTPRQTPRPKKTKSSCDPNYSGACVPIASDVDCAGGSGNGPAYLSEAAKITGSDIYDLDADGDGWGCEPW
jgi:hypothetical protein